MAQGEHGTKYFFALEKSQAKAKTMKTTYDQNGRLVSKPKQVLEIQQQFYQNLYTLDPRVNCKISCAPEKRLTEEQKTKLDMPITLEEVQNNIKAMAKGKSPGTSGFSIDIYVVFWLRLKDHFMEMLDWVMSHGQLGHSLLEGIISLIPKKGRDCKYVKNWRLIVLLNTSYKIISKIIATRIKEVLPSIINKDQCGFVAGRNISDNLRRILDIIDYTELENVPSVFVSIDFLKAFDRVEHNSVYKVMEWFNFGPTIIEWVSILFKNIRLATINNGFTSPWFNPTRGLLQGNPVASFLFVILIELLAVSLRSNKKLKESR